MKRYAAALALSIATLAVATADARPAQPVVRCPVQTVQTYHTHRSQNYQPTDLIPHQIRRPHDDPNGWPKEIA